MQPKSIKRFDLFYLGSLAVYAIGYFLGFDAQVEAQREKLAAAGVQMNIGAIMTASFFVGILIGLLLWWFISQKGSNVAKWILVVLFALGVLGTIYSLVTGSMTLTLYTDISLLSLVLEAVAIYLLFQPDAKAWLERERPQR